MPAELVTLKMSWVGLLVEVCLIDKPVVAWPVGERFWVEVGLLVKQLTQEEPEILAQIGTPAVVVKTCPEVPMPKLVKVVAPEA